LDRRRRSLSQGDVVLVTWPFTDLSGAKLRPAVVVSNDELNAAQDDVVLLAVSSTVARTSAYDLLLEKSDPAFKDSGLKVPSIVRCAKVFTAEGGRLVRRRLGKLSGVWFSKVVATVEAVFRPSPEAT